MSDELARLHAIHGELNRMFQEREELIRGALAALLAQEHVLLLGPVGTAKSMLAVELCQRIQGARYFGWLLTRFSTPEELFGAISVRALQEDRYERIPTGRLPEAHIGFLDEIFKANSAILNSLLAVINERVFHNGTQAVAVPLVTLFAASNELPEEEELLALFDRFLVRYVVDYIQDDKRFLKMLTAEEGAAPHRTRLSLTELQLLQDRVRRVRIEEGVLGDVVELRRLLGSKGIVASDRRYRRALNLLRAFALLDGRSQVVSGDLAELAHVLWSDPSEREEVRALIQRVFHGHEERAQALLEQARDVQSFALRGWGDPETAMRAGIEAHTKLKRIQSSLDDLMTEARSRSRRTSEVQRVIQEVEAIQRRILEEGV